MLGHLKLPKPEEDKGLSLRLLWSQLTMLCLGAIKRNWLDHHVAVNLPSCCFT